MCLKSPVIGAPPVTGAGAPLAWPHAASISFVRTSGSRAICGSMATASAKHLDAERPVDLTADEDHAEIAPELGAERDAALVRAAPGDRRAQPVLGLREGGAEVVLVHGPLVESTRLLLDLGADREGRAGTEERDCREDHGRGRAREETAPHLSTTRKGHRGRTTACSARVKASRASPVPPEPRPSRASRAAARCSCAA